MDVVAAALCSAKGDLCVCTRETVLSAAFCRLICARELGMRFALYLPVYLGILLYVSPRHINVNIIVDAV